MEGTFEATFHELGSRASLVPLRDIQQHGYKMLKTHKPCSRTSLVPLRAIQQHCYKLFKKLINRALVLVWCHFVEGTFEATFHELGSRPSLVPLRDMQQRCYRRFKTHKSCSRTSLVPLLGCSCAAPGVLLGCSWAASGLSWARFPIDFLIKPD